MFYGGASLVGLPRSMCRLMVSGQISGERLEHEPDRVARVRRRQGSHDLGQRRRALSIIEKRQDSLPESRA